MGFYIITRRNISFTEEEEGSRLLFLFLSFFLLSFAISFFLSFYPPKFIFFSLFGQIFSDPGPVSEQWELIGNRTLTVLLTHLDSPAEHLFFVSIPGYPAPLYFTFGEYSHSGHDVAAFGLAEGNAQVGFWTFVHFTIPCPVMLVSRLVQRA